MAKGDLVPTTMLPVAESASENIWVALALGIRDWGLRFRVQGLGLRAWGLKV